MRFVTAVLLGAALAGCGGGGGGGTTARPRVTTTTGIEAPQDVRVVVLNGSGVAGAAAAKADALKALGYDVLGVANAGEHQAGTVVACRAGFQAESVALSTVVGAGTTIVPFPEPTPEGAQDADCLVGLGT